MRSVKASFASLAAIAAPVPQAAAASPPPPAALVAPTQGDLDRFAAGLGFRYEILSNHPADCPKARPDCFAVDLVLTTPKELPDGVGASAALRFSFVNGIAQAPSDTFSLRPVNGDLQEMTLRPGARWRAGRTYRIRILGNGHWFSTYFAMPNASLAVPGLSARVVEATRPRIDPETGLETLPFVAAAGAESALATQARDDATRWLTPERAYDAYVTRGPAAAVDVAILPTPREARRSGGGPLDLSRGILFQAKGVARAELAPAIDALAAAGVGRGPVPVRVTVGTAAKTGAEGYRLSIGPDGVDVSADDAAGAAYALRSLAQQVAAEGTSVRPLAVSDAPRLPFRGLHVDLARNFHGAPEILKLVEQMAAYKLNKLHLHLGDDEGWRLEVPTLPELTRVGAFRCLDASERTCLQPQLGGDPDPKASTNGFLSRDDYLRILLAAKARHIEVIPSFDMPGHSRAAIVSMEARYRRLSAEGRPAEAERYRLVEPADATRYRSIQNYDDNTLNVCLESTYRFLDTVIDAVAEIHRAAGTPLRTYHIGADETAGAWAQSPTCRARMARTGERPEQLGAAFIERVSADLSKRGIVPAGWSDGMNHASPARMPAVVQSNIWGGLFTGGVREAHDQLNRGWRVVISMPDVTYLDMPYAPDFMERGYDWGTRGTDAFKAFAFMPENLPANAATITDVQSRAASIPDEVPVQPGRRLTGLQAQIWSETVRGDQQVDYMLFPRVLALAERAWHRADWEPGYVAGRSYGGSAAGVDVAALRRDWAGFAGRVGAQLPALDRAGVAYRLAPPGARMVDGRLRAIAEFPGEIVEYRQDGGAWRRYVEPVAVSGRVSVRSRSPDGRRAGREVALEGAR